MNKLEVELSEWDDKIKRFEIQAQKATLENKLEYIEHVAHLKSKQKIARKKHEELEQVHESVWEGLRDGIDSIFDDMLSYTEAVMSKFKD
ncbi:MAG: hypothetical protein QGI94_09215 [Candidatus Scalindua sp.]|nr:hypothetical protein [Candidatus Scalindua sp.]